MGGNSGRVQTLYQIAFGEEYNRGLKTCGIEMSDEIVESQFPSTQSSGMIKQQYLPGRTGMRPVRAAYNGKGGLNGR
jgi:hypothetical protein